jgi:hypothetical protein
LHETFCDSSALLVTLFVAVGNAELNNKKALYTMGQKAFAIKTFYCSGDSSVALERQYLREFSVCVASSRGALYRTVEQFEEAGSCMS